MKIWIRVDLHGFRVLNLWARGLVHLCGVYVDESWLFERRAFVLVRAFAVTFEDSRKRRERFQRFRGYASDASDNTPPTPSTPSTPSTPPRVRRIVECVRSPNTRPRLGTEGQD